MLQLKRILPSLNVYQNGMKAGTNRFRSDLQSEIKIPARIERSATDILRALESTIGRDPTAAHFKYHDDPYLMPFSTIGKRSFALSQESGRNAAKWIKKQHPELFQHSEADPVIPQFLGKTIIDENTECSAELLDELVTDRQVSSAIFVFDKLAEKNIVIADSLKVRLFELICFYNAEDCSPDENIEERWFENTTQKPNDRMQKTWKTNGLAEKMFDNFAEKTPELYSALIAGMIKYKEMDAAYKLFCSARNENIRFALPVYNRLLTAVPFLAESSDERWKLTEKLLGEIRDEALMPDSQTLNAVLVNVLRMGDTKSQRKLAMKVFNEFTKRLHVEASLGTWFLLLMVFQKDRNVVRFLLNDVIEKLIGKELQIQDYCDTRFFVSAMELSCHQLNDLQLGHRLYDLFCSGRNRKLIGNAFNETVFMRSYFLLILRNQPLDMFMREIYDDFVPNLYVPEVMVIQELLDVIEIEGGASKYVPKLWNDIVIFDLVRIESLPAKIIEIMRNYCRTATNDQHRSEFGRVAFDIWTRLIEKFENRQQTRASHMQGPMIGEILKLVLSADNMFDQACTIITNLRTNKYIIGSLSTESLNMFIDRAIAESMPTQAIIAIEYCANNDLENVNESIEKMKSKMTLSKEFLDRLEFIRNLN